LYLQISGWAKKEKRKHNRTHKGNSEENEVANGNNEGELARKECPSGHLTFM
jgi:hypothetical protein